MPTAKPRISLTLDEGEADVLRRLASVQGRPVSSIVRDLLVSAIPTLRDVAETMEALQEAGEAARERLAVGTASDWENAQKALQPRLEAILGAMRDLSSSVVAEASEEGATGESAQPEAPSSDASRPPYTNRGVRSPRDEGSERGAKITIYPNFIKLQRIGANGRPYGGQSPFGLVPDGEGEYYDWNEN